MMLLLRPLGQDTAKIGRYLAITKCDTACTVYNPAPLFTKKIPSYLYIDSRYEGSYTHKTVSF